MVPDVPMTRRTMLATTAAMASTLPLVGRTDASPSQPRTGLGVVMYDCRLRRKLIKKQTPGHDLYDPFTFVEHCRAIGAGGAHVALGSLPPERAEKLRRRADDYGLFIDGIVSPPKDESDVSRFDAEIATAAAVGVQAVRTVIIPGRRYERFDSFEAFREFEKRGRRMMELAAPVVERHRVSLAIENHKDQRLDDRLALYDHIGSEFVGACIDTGNSISLLDGAYETIEALAPHAMSVHFKDQALDLYEDGFLLGDIPLGQGSLDLPRIVRIIRSHKPDVRFSLEVLTRDPLRVPCLTEGYWDVVSDAAGRDLARTLRLVRGHRKSGQTVSTLPLEKQVALEDANIAASLRHAAEELGL